MQESQKSREELIQEITKLRREIEERNSRETNYKRIENALRISESRYRSLVENTADVIFTLDRSWNFTFLNPRFQEITGYSIYELLWHPLAEIVSQDDTEILSDDFREKVLNGKIVKSETNIIHKDNKKISIELIFIPMDYESNSDVINVLVAGQDISRHKKNFEDSLKIQKLESIGILAGGIAHDFNNILTAILGNISLSRMYLESEDAEDKAMERLKEAEDASIQAKSLTQRLLTFAKGGSPVRKPISLVNLLKDSAEFAISGSDSVCDFDIDEDLWMINADEGQISQIVNNIVVNADQAMPEGGRIKLIAKNVDIEENILPLKPGRHVKISIEDHGHGISEENINQVFDPYFTTRQSSGLGLSTAYSIVRKHKGYIDVDSKVGEGTVFHIYLPALDENEIKEENIENTDKASAIASALIGDSTTKRLLLIDESDSISGNIIESIEAAGYDINRVSELAGALELYKEAKESGLPYNFVIISSDVFKGNNINNIIRELKQVYPEVNIVLSVDHPDNPISAEYVKYGFQYVISKPYNEKDLMDMMEKL